MASIPDAIPHAFMPGNTALLGLGWRQSPQKFPHSARASPGKIRHCRSYWPLGPPPLPSVQWVVSRSSPQTVPWPAVSAASRAIAFFPAVRCGDGRTANLPDDEASSACSCLCAFFPAAASDARAWRYGAANAAMRSRRDVDAVGSLITSSMYPNGMTPSARGAADRASALASTIGGLPFFGRPAPGRAPPRPGAGALISVIC